MIQHYGSYLIKNTRDNRFEEGELVRVLDIINEGTIVLCKIEIVDYVTRKVFELENNYYGALTEDFEFIDWFSLTDRQRFLCKLGNYSCIE